MSSWRGENASVEKREEVLFGKEKRNGEEKKCAFEQRKGNPWPRNGEVEVGMHVTFPFFRFLELYHCFHFYPYSCSANSPLDERLFTHPLMTSINVLSLPPSVKDTLLKGKESFTPASEKKVRPLFLSVVSPDYFTFFYWAQPR